MCCGCWPQFHDDRGLHNGNQFNWNYTINFNKNTKIPNLKIFDKDGKVLYNDSWSYSREKTLTQPQYLPSPEEMDLKEWMEIMNMGELKAEITTDQTLPSDPTGRI